MANSLSRLFGLFPTIPVDAGMAEEMKISRMWWDRIQPALVEKKAWVL
jgi:hypothetical protein